jgi:serine/threonine-protein kinase
MMLSQIEHPNVVAVFDLGLCAPLESRELEAVDVVFVVMELVRGLPLDVWIDRHRPGVDDVLDVISHVAAGLDAVHAAGLVHCDVKPGNILVADGSAKLADFGLAHAIACVADDFDLAASVASRVGATTQVTARSTTRLRGGVVGTPRYMPPEQLSGDPVGPRADVYALAVTLFEALFGAAPHRGSSHAALLAAKQRGAPRCPDPWFSRAAYAVIARALSPVVPVRHESASAFVHALVRASKRARRRRRFAWLGLAMAAALGVSVPHDSPSSCESREAVALRAPKLLARLEQRIDIDAGRHAARIGDRLAEHAQQITDTRTHACEVEPRSSRTLQCLARTEAHARATVSALDELPDDELHRADALLAQLFDPESCLRSDGAADTSGPAFEADDPRLERGWKRFGEARLAIASGDRTVALALLDEIASDAALARLHDEVELTRARVLVGLGRFEEAEIALAAVFERASGSERPLLAARAAIAAAELVGVEQHRFDDGMRWIRHGGAELRRASVDTELEHDLANVEGFLFLAKGEPDEALPRLEHALELARHHDDGDGGLVSAARANLAAAMVAAGDPQGVDLMQSAHEELEERLGPGHPAVADSMANLGHTLARGGRHDEARILLERALVLREGFHGPDALGNAPLLSMLAELDRAQNDLFSASARLRRVHALHERVLAHDDPELANDILALVGVLLDLGELAEADRLIDASADRFVETLPAEHPYSAGLQRARGIIALRRGDAARAAELCGRDVVNRSGSPAPHGDGTDAACVLRDEP